MSQAPAGWYPDPAPTPSPQPMVRWWDGGRWTEHVQPAWQPTADRPSTDDGRPLGGFGWRILAYFIDSVVLGVATSLATFPAQLDVQRRILVQQAELQRQLDAGATPSFDAFVDGMLDAYADHLVAIFVVPAIAALVYHAGFLRWRGATPGKLATGLRVEPAASSGRLSWRTITLRLGVQVMVAWLLLGLGFASGGLGILLLAAVVASAFGLADVLWALGRRRRALHDLVAGTVVVHVR
ncbi:MAG TPA: RDD family protein [Nocardioides sp.]|nr:RDD family protein [Nocardioides sp.]